MGYEQLMAALGAVGVFVRNMEGTATLVPAGATPSGTVDYVQLVRTSSSGVNPVMPLLQRRIQPVDSDNLFFSE